MFLKIVMNDVRRKKIITATVLVFIAMAVVLGSSATNIIANLMQSIAQLKTHAVPSDLTQMHIGPYDQEAVDTLIAALDEHIAEQETMFLLNIEGSDIHFGANRTMVDTVQDISFVVQNRKFDFILDLDNRKLEIQAGEVAVPIYFMKTYGLNLGDVLRIESRGFLKEFVISEYARDFEMNSALASSKRFVINQADYDEMLAHQVGDMEYLIEFKLHEHGDLRTVRNAYREAGLPSNGPTIEGKLFSLFNALSDAAVVMVIVLISLLLVVVASLCIRLTFLATIDEDLREIGVMKAMGISRKDIRNVYLMKYKIVA
ncbi:MAG: FtsX-like permease family protein, partial [Sphaerochaetaceae bacterium]